MPREISEWIVQWVENRVTGLAFTFAMVYPDMRDRIVAAADRGVQARRVFVTMLATAAEQSQPTRATRRASTIAQA